MQPRYPVYVISKGRWDSRLTVKALEFMKVPFKIVIEPQEYVFYSAVIDKAKILQLPFSNLGQGSIPARNWVWEHALTTGAERHWIIDDNIVAFRRANRNKRHLVTSGITLRLMEDFTERYTNVALSGPNYRFFVPCDGSQSPIYINTRVYSCILIKNDLPYRWRGRYNEDTDLCLRALKDGWCTILFNAFPIDKQATMTMKGGNSDELYKGDGRLQMAQSLVDQHPDIVTITEKWGRYQHQVDYSGFTQKLIKKNGVQISADNNEYGMRLMKKHDYEMSLLT